MNCQKKCRLENGTCVGCGRTIEEITEKGKRVRKIIVVEGVDNSGKTTLALELAKRLRAVFVKVERPAKGNDLPAFSNILEVASLYSGIVVIDRHVAISEPIYGEIIRGGHALREDEMKSAIARVTDIVYCRPPTDVIMGTLEVRGQMEGVVKHAAELLKAYDFLFEEDVPGVGHKLHRYDYTQKDALVNLLKELSA